MSNPEQPRYYAIISLSLSDSDEKVTANVTLAPADSVPTPTGAKPLHACTVADLQAYAASLEKEAWHTYREITLLELSKQEEFDFSLTILDESGSALTGDREWMEQVVLLPAPEMQGETAVEEIPVTEVAALESNPETEPAVEASAVKEEDPRPALKHGEPESGTNTELKAAPIPPLASKVQPPEPEEIPVETIPVLDEEPHIVVAAAEAIFTERDATPKEVTTTQDGTQIAPSRARVRVAGQKRPPDSYTRAAIDIFIEEPALRSAQAHALTSLNREVAGVLVGPRPEKQPDGSYVVQIMDTIIAKHTVMQGASVTYTPESWRYMNDKLHERYPDETAVIVGWYHTHPGFGIFLSGMDLFIHQNFFTQIWHVAFVIDPRAKTSGFFSWNREKTEVKRVDFLWPHWAPGSW